jgi:hypothetical protein
VSQEPPSQTSVSTQPQPDPSSQPIVESKVGKIDLWLEGGFGVIDAVGKQIFGNLWDLVFESVQDALAFGVMAALPSWILKTLTGGEDFTDWNSCFKIPTSDVDLYFCLAAVAGGFAGVVIFSGRLLQRFVRSIPLPRRKGGGYGKKP